MLTSGSLTSEVNNYSQHLATDLIGRTSIIYSFFAFDFQTLLLNSDRKGPFQPTFSMEMTTAFKRTDSVECVGQTLHLALKKERKNISTKH